MKKTGVCPIRSDELLAFAINTICEDGVPSGFPEELSRKQAKRLCGLLPDYYMPDIYMDLPLMGGAWQGFSAVFDCYDRCYVNYRSEGEYWKSIHIPSYTAPKDRDTLLIISDRGSGPEYHTLNRRFQEIPPKEALHVLPSLGKLSDVPLEYTIFPENDGIKIIFTTGRQTLKDRFIKREYKNKILEVLTDAGCGEGSLRILDDVSFNCAAPYLYSEDVSAQWILSVDAAAFILTLRNGTVTDCHAAIRISDRSVDYSMLPLKPTQAYQWHITDECDQRCRHCYLFAEDARLKCVTAPYEDLIHILDEITDDAASRNAVPMPAVSGGDPILHPDFLKFALELHKRGLHWLIMGNPFHLTEDVCRQLHELGCFKYQLSMDGLVEYHDHMRKPGSFQATLDAVKLLNEAGIQTQLMATVSRQNMEDVLKCMDIAAEHHVTSFTFARYCATDPEKARDYPSPEEYRDFLLRYLNKSQEYAGKGCKTRFREKEHLFTLLRYELGLFTPSGYSRRNPDMIFDGCHLGQNCAILPNGDVLACRRMESVIGNIKTDRIKDILNSDLCQKYADITNIRKCRECELLQWCRGCRAVGYNASGDLQCEDPCCWKEI